MGADSHLALSRHQLAEAISTAVWIKQHRRIRHRVPTELLAELIDIGVEIRAPLITDTSGSPYITGLSDRERQLELNVRIDLDAGDADAEETYAAALGDNEPTLQQLTRHFVEGSGR